MYGHGRESGVFEMTERDEIVTMVSDRFERRLLEETGKLDRRVTEEVGKLDRRMTEEFGKVRVEISDGFGTLRAEMIDRNAELLKWGLIFGAAQTGALAAVMALLR
jgi:hypothetical protein